MLPAGRPVLSFSSRSRHKSYQLQYYPVMRRLIRNFNIPPPRAYPGHLTVHRARGGRNLNVALEGWGI